MNLIKAWFLSYFSGLVFLSPYQNLYFEHVGLRDTQIGLLALLRTWTTAPASFFWSGIADRYRAHRSIMLLLVLFSTVFRSSMALTPVFWQLLALVALSQFFGGPITVLADTATMAVCKDDGAYGKHRLWGAIGWGGMSTLAGWLITRHGIYISFWAFFLVSIPAIILAAFMPFEELYASHGRQGRGPGQGHGQGQQEGAAGVELGMVAVSRQGSEGDSWVEELHLLPLPAEGPVCLHEEEQQGQQWQGQEQRDYLHWDSASSLRVSPVEGQQQQQQQRKAGRQVQVVVEEERGVGFLQQQRHRLARAGSPHAFEDVQLGGDEQGLLDQREGGSSCGEAGAKAGRGQKQHVGDRRAGHPDQQGQQQGQEEQQQKGQAQHHHQSSAEFWAGLIQLLSSPAVLVFMWQAVVMGFGVGIIQEYLFLYLQELGGSGTLMGLSLTVTCAAEIPAFHFQGKLLALTGVSGMLHLVLGVFALRLACYFMLPWWGSPWAVLPVELLHGVTFACGWGAGTINCKRVAPPGLEATMQGIFQGLYFGVGQGLGGIIGGALKERFGSQNLFGLAACCILAGWASVVVAERVCKLRGVDGAVSAVSDGKGGYTRVVESE